MKNAQRLVTTTVLNTKTVEVENKIPLTSGLVSTTVLCTKIGKVYNKIPEYSKYITTAEFNKFTGSIFDTKLKKRNLATNSGVNTVSQYSNKNKEKIVIVYDLDN